LARFWESIPRYQYWAHTTCDQSWNVLANPFTLRVGWSGYTNLPMDLDRYQWNNQNASWTLKIGSVVFEL
jgi:hypothetical protein